MQVEFIPRQITEESEEAGAPGSTAEGYRHRDESAPSAENQGSRTWKGSLAVALLELLHILCEFERKVR